ncbi:ABC transporter permease subunit [Viridibacillus sp. NPDC096237]|uniref:ABC transporter permease subunit n=1 Tax=Viridibacillus sp. NPDC096237 TaxID=3390721 RepID=UPI003D05C736
MNMFLFKANLRSQSKNFFSYAVGSLFYLWILIWVFPSIVSTEGVNKLIKSMPESLLKATGLSGGIQELNSYLAGEYYGLVFLLLLMIFSVVVSTQLVAHHVDKGSMAYLLTTPVSRTKIALTQAITLVLGLLIVILVTYVGGLVGVYWLLDDYEINHGLFLKMNLVGGLLFLVVCSYTFFFSCLFNDEKQSLGASAGLTIFFYGLDMVGKLSDDFEVLRNFSVFNLFRPQEIVSGNYEVGIVSIILFSVAVLIFAISIIVFKKRDLPL